MAVRRMGLSARAHDRILKVARTDADLGGSTAVSAKHVSRGPHATAGAADPRRRRLWTSHHQFACESGAKAQAFGPFTIHVQGDKQSFCPTTVAATRIEAPELFPPLVRCSNGGAKRLPRIQSHQSSGLHCPYSARCPSSTTYGATSLPVASLLIREDHQHRW
jgi:hypothetical protein